MSERKLHVERFRYRIGGHVGAAVAMSLVASLQSRVIPYGMRLPRALSPARSPTCELNELRRSLPKFETLHLRYSSHKRSSWQPAKEES